MWSLAHDAFTRLLRRLKPDAAALWAEVEPQVHKRSGVLIVDDTMLDEPYAKKMELVTRHWSGKHHQVANGINLIPCGYRLYDKGQDGPSNTMP